MCQDEDKADCLTTEQVKTLRSIYQGPRYNDGEPIHPGYTAGMEAELTRAWGGTGNRGWASTVTGGNAEHGAEAPRYNRFKEIYRYLIKQGGSKSLESFDFNKDYTRALTKRLSGQSLTTILNADNPDLSAFQAKGGKLLMFYGWGDEIHPAQGSIDYYTHITKHMGGLDKTQDFAKLFMVPGLMHCVGGPGANAFGQYGSDAYPKALKDDPEHDIIRALEAWVEDGRDPENIIATKYHSDRTDRGAKFTRLLCPHPQIGVYQGKGDINKAESFSCVEGKTLD